jgi:hypothetical protein
MFKKGYMVIALAIISASLGSLFYNTIQARSDVKITTNILVELQTTASFIGFKFNGLSIIDAYSYRVTNGTVAALFPEIYINQIRVQKVPYDDDSYLRMEIPLKVHVSNETVTVVLRHVPASGYVTYVTVKIYDSNGNLIGTFTVSGSTSEFKTFYILADEFKPSP